MVDRVLSPIQRRIVQWGMIALIFSLMIAGSIALLRRALGGSFFGKPAPPAISQQMVVDRLREVAQLVATEMTLRDVVTYEQTRFHSTKRMLLVVTAKVNAGIELATGTQVHIDSTLKRITVSVPPAHILSVDVVTVTTYDEQAGLWNPFRAEDRDAIQGRIREQLILTAQQSGILRHADESAAKVLTNLLARDGYTVEIRHPPVLRASPG